MENVKIAEWQTCWHQGVGKGKKNPKQTPYFLIITCLAGRACLHHLFIHLQCQVQLQQGSGCQYGCCCCWRCSSVEKDLHFLFLVCHVGVNFPRRCHASHTDARHAARGQRCQTGKHLKLFLPCKHVVTLSTSPWLSDLWYWCQWLYWLSTLSVWDILSRICCNFTVVTCTQ